jgi:hypothetical protein
MPGFIQQTAWEQRPFTHKVLVGFFECCATDFSFYHPGKRSKMQELNELWKIGVTNSQSVVLPW